MKAKYIGETSPLELTNGEIYQVLSVEKDWYRVVDDTGDDYLYPPNVFEVLNEQHCSIDERQSKRQRLSFKCVACGGTFK